MCRNTLLAGLWENVRLPARTESHDSQFMGRTGLEPVTVTARKNSKLQNQAVSGGAESGADSADLAQIDSDLQHIIDAWPDLPEPIKAGVLAMVKAANGENL